MADIQDQSHQEQKNSECPVRQIALVRPVRLRFYLAARVFGLLVCFWGW